MLRIIRERILPKVGPWSIGVFVAICLAATAAIIGLGRLKNYVVSLSDFNINVESITIADPPAWAPQALGAEIRAAMPKEANVFDRDLPRKVYKSCKNLYWVEQIDSVRKVYPNTLELKMKLRTPAAYVLYGGEPYLVDLKGKRLPRHYYQKPDGVQDMLIIKGVEGIPPEPGGQWVDHEALTSALAVVENIANTTLCRKAGITTVDVANFVGRKTATDSHIVLWTKDQTRILWGRSSNNHKFGDLSIKEKLANMDKALNEYNNLAKIEYVNVYSVANQCPGKYRSVGGHR
jgi:hypothetical protein